MYETDPHAPTTDELAPADDAIAPPSRGQDSGRKTARATIVGALVVGGLAGAAILGPLSAAAASPSPAAAISSPASTTLDHAGGPGGFGRSETVSDTSVVAKAIGITETELKTALSGGQTVAAVAKAHNVPLQTVIDALVADGTSELAARVASGSITQAQADAQKAAILQRATDQANGSFEGGRP